MRSTVALLICLLTLGGAALAGDTYYVVYLSDLELSGGELPMGAISDPGYVVLDGPGEAYLDGHDSGRHRRLSGVRLAVRAPAGGEVTGTLVVPEGGQGMAKLRFKLAGTKGDALAGASFRKVKEDHYGRLLRSGVAGAAWFRHRLMESVEQLEINDRDLVRRMRGQGMRGARRSFDFFTGGRAVSENLQLDRAMPGGKRAEATVPLESIKGIGVAEMDWTPYLAGLKVETDWLASHIPADQYALLLPDFKAMLALLDAANESGTPLLHAVERRPGDARTRERYERQLCLAADALSRALGPHIIKSVAFTGSDPFLRSGTDVAVLFEPADDAAALARLIRARRAARAGDASQVKGEVKGIAYDAVVSPGRVVCSYQATIKGAVVVTNSLFQLRRIAAAAQGDARTLFDLPEYTFFRRRYRKSEKEETGLLVIPDAAIRKWCGPRWRIAASRRVRADAVLAALEAKHMDRLVQGNGGGAQALASPWPLVDAGYLEVGDQGVTSTIFNRRTFQTPIAELEFDTVTEEEAEFYQRWRDGYEREWSNFFDPIAARFSVAKGRLGVDLTVMPLIMQTQYRRWLDVVKNAKIAVDAGDRHREALIHFTMALDADSQPVRMGTGFLVMMGAKVGANPLSWIGGSISLYLDRDDLFTEAARADDPEDFLESNLHRLPVALHCEVKSPMKLTLFLASMRAWIEQTAPGMTDWTNHKYGEHEYVRVAPSAEARAQAREVDRLAVYYSVQPDMLVVTLSEDLLKRALDRRQNRVDETATKEAATKEAAAKETERPWLGKHLCLRADRELFEMAESFLGTGKFRAEMQKRSWGNLWILNEWKRLYQKHDPVDLHERVFGVRLVCPGGGRYVWNDDWKTMESTAFGHPGEPKRGPADVLPFAGWKSGRFGLTFEKDGLRAVCELIRENEKQAAAR